MDVIIEIYFKLYAGDDQNNVCGAVNESYSQVRCVSLFSGLHTTARLLNHITLELGCILYIHMDLSFEKTKYVIVVP